MTVGAQSRPPGGLGSLLTRGLGFHYNNFKVPGPAVPANLAHQVLQAHNPAAPVTARGLRGLIR